MAPEKLAEAEHFRFFDNREKYLLFVNTCNEKSVVAERVGMEIDQITPSPPALRVFDGGVGDATVLTHVMRDLHQRYPTIPFFVAGKEISLEDTRISLRKMPDRFVEHPLTVLVMTNMLYSEAPYLLPKKPEDQARVKWWNIELKGNTAYEFDTQIAALQAHLNEGWQTKTSSRTGNLLPVHPSVIVIYRADQRFALDPIIPQPGQAASEYDLVMAVQPYRARLEAEKKVQYVLGPLAQVLSPGGRMIVIQSTGRDPGMEIINKIWPEEHPFWTPRDVLIDALEAKLGENRPDLVFDRYSNQRSMFTYYMHALPDEFSSTIGTSTLLAAWNAAIYVAQIEDERLTQVLSSGEYLEATRDVLNQYRELWFLNESFAVVRDAQLANGP